jgi:hypothetical protein
MTQVGAMAASPALQEQDGEGALADARGAVSM